VRAPVGLNVEEPAPDLFGTDGGADCGKPLAPRHGSTLSEGLVSLFTCVALTFHLSRVGNTGGGLLRNWVETHSRACLTSFLFESRQKSCLFDDEHLGELNAGVAVSGIPPSHLNFGSENRCRY
jgi:hypothetical protein